MGRCLRTRLVFAGRLRTASRSRKTGLHRLAGVAPAPAPSAVGPLGRPADRAASTHHDLHGFSPRSPRVFRMSKIKAIVFDMDGVLIDAKEWHYEALNRAIGLFGYTISRYDHLVSYDGLPTRRKLEMLTREEGLPTSLHGFLNELKQIYTMELTHAKCKPLFCHEYALAKLKGLGYKVAV